MSLSRPAAGGESCKQDSFLLHCGGVEICRYCSLLQIRKYVSNVI